jgi:hypothetical protein
VNILIQTTLALMAVAVAAAAGVYAVVWIVTGGISLFLSALPIP